MSDEENAPEENQFATAENMAALCADLSNSLIRFSLRFSQLAGTKPLVKDPEEEGKKKKKKKRYVDPNAPKKPHSAYVQFLQDHRQQVVEDNPDMKQTEIMSKIGNMWSNLDEKKKNKYIKQYDKELKEYEKEFKQYKKENPDAGKPPASDDDEPKKGAKRKGKASGGKKKKRR